MKVYKNGKILLENKIIENHIVIASDIILEIRPGANFVPLPEHEIVDLKGHYLAPGFVDVHIHGSNGFDTMDGTMEGLKEISKALPSSGVTSYLATTMSMPKESTHLVLKQAQALIKNQNHQGAELLGIHVEGPFIADKCKGAQNPNFIEVPDYDFYTPYYDVIKLITLAPETDTNYGFTKKINQQHHDIILSIGHSNATYDQAVEAFDHGFKHISHLFNGMSGLHHREPGVVGAALIKDFYTEIIADNIHIRPELYSLILKAKGKHHIILITDAMCAACLEPGEYKLGGQKVIVDNNSARLESGVLAGSILRMNKAIKNFYKHTNLTIWEAINLATKNPAEQLGLYHRIGSIEVHKDADFVVFDDSFNIQKTFCKGQLTYSKEDVHGTDYC